MSSTTNPAQPAALDEVMLAMDVVDTLRHHENLAVKELDQEGRDDQLKERLRRIYESQGLEVSDRILDEGIKALKDSRFTYEPAQTGSRLWANMWVKRGFYGKVFALLAVVLLAWLVVSSWHRANQEKAIQAARVELAETLPRQLEDAASSTLREARVEEARERASALHADGVTALAQGDRETARNAIGALNRLRAQLLQTYQLRIVSRPGEDTGVFRIPDVNSNARNYYLIVEAVTPDGKALSMPIRNEENSTVETVTRWGVRVPQQTFDAARRDKQNDGILQNNILGEKQRGALEPVYRMSTLPGAITKW